MPHSQSMSIKPYPRMVGQFGPLDISSALLQGITVVESAMLYVGGHRGTSASAAHRVRDGVHGCQRADILGAQAVGRGLEVGRGGPDDIIADCRAWPESAVLGCYGPCTPIQSTIENRFAMETAKGA